MKGFIRKNKVNTAVLLFLLIALLIHYNQPPLLYTNEGGFREFGVGYTHKTVIPIWLVMILSAIFSYYIVLNYLAYM
tara:strand:- start:1661 stop:1891 length:231 start_codon:yes stop_codon:yes gene_type:complete